VYETILALNAPYMTSAIIYSASMCIKTEPKEAQKERERA